MKEQFQEIDEETMKMLEKTGFRDPGNKGKDIYAEQVHNIPEYQPLDGPFRSRKLRFNNKKGAAADSFSAGLKKIFIK